jgi:uncharacterized membrane protein
MRKTATHVATELPPSPDEELHGREVKYLIMMGIRVICVILIVVLAVTVHGWWWVIPAFGAVLLPYFAVVVANAAGPGRREKVERPGGLVYVRREDNEG